MAGIFQILLLGDSRLRGFSYRLRELSRVYDLHDVNFSVCFFPGASLDQVVERGITSVNLKYDLVYLHAGVNNLSIKMGKRTIKPSMSTEEEIAETMNNNFRLAKEKLLSTAHAVVICELIGLSYMHYNINGKDFPAEQKELHKAIPRINSCISSINNGSGMLTPWIACHVHKTRHGRLGHRYNGTMVDGIHYNDATKDKFTRAIIKSIYPNIHAICN